MCMTSYSMWDGKRLTVRELAELALLCALTVAGKEVMSVLPNIHPVTVLFLLGVLVYGWKAMYVAVGFAVIEIALYGFGLWTVNYLYIWPLLVAAAMPFRGSRSPLFWGAFGGIYGLSFGALCAIPYFFIGGWQMALSYWVAGIPFDLLHCAANAVLCFVLLMPLYRLVMKSKEN